MKKIILLIISIVITGCYNYTEINNLVLVNGIYIDYKDDKYYLKVDIDKTINSSGESLSEAFRNFEESISKKAYYAHIKVIIISKEVLTNHFDEVCKYILRNNEMRNNFYLAVSNNINTIKSNDIKNTIINNNDVISSSLFKKVLTTYLDNKEIILPTFDNSNITGAIIKNKKEIRELTIDDARIYKIYINSKPNIVYKNINIYHSHVKKTKNNLYIYLDIELKEEYEKNIKKDLKKDLERVLNKKVILNIDINRNGKIINE